MVPEGWVTITIGKVAAEVTARFTPTYQDERSYIGLEHIASSTGSFLGVGSSHEVTSSKTVFQAGDVLFGKLRPYLRKVALADFDGVCSTDILAIRPSPRMTSKYLACLLASKPVIQAAISSSAGTKMPRTSWNALRDLEVALPPVDEQQKITEVLTSVGIAIKSNDAVINQTRRVKQGVLQELLTRGIGHTRFKQSEIGEIPLGWAVRSVASLMEQVQEPVEVNPTAEYREIGIRSHAKGIFHKEPIYGESLGSKRVFWIQPGCLVLNIVFAWEGAVASTSEAESGMIASHRFPTWRPHSREVDLRYLTYYFQSKKGVEALSSVSPGGAGRNKTLNQSEFARLRIPVPSLLEQQEIADSVQAITAALMDQERAARRLVEVKEGLMRDLLTGCVRVPTAI